MRALAYLPLVWLVLDLLLGAALARLHPDPFFRRSLDEMRAAVDVAAERDIYDRVRSARTDASSYVIGVFGGSVAYDLGRHIQYDVEPSPLMSALESAVGRDVVVVNLAISGGAQPSQYNIARVTLDSLDAVVSVAGFNELFRPGFGCAEAEAYWSSAGADRLRGLSRSHEQLERSSRLVGSAWARVGTRLGSWRMVAFRISRTAALDVGSETATWGGAIALEDTTDPVAAWGECVRATSRAAASAGVPYVALVQPNQHVDDSKPLTAEERALMADGLANVGSEVRAVYDHMTESYDALDAEVAALASEGVRAASLRWVFREVDETLYSDFCCHLNLAGNRILADEVWRHLLPAISAPTPATSVPTPDSVFAP